MKVLKRNILNGQTVEVNIDDAFDELMSNDVGLMKNWDINNFDEFVEAFVKDKEMEITCRDWTFENIPGKKSHEDFILKLRDGELKEYMDSLVKTAEWVLRDLKDYQKRLNSEEYMKNTKPEDIIRWAINRAQQINWQFDNGADVICRYAEAKISKEFSEKRGI